MRFVEFLVPGQPGRGLHPKPIDRIKPDTVFAVRIGSTYLVPIDGDHLPLRNATEMQIADYLRSQIDMKFIKLGMTRRMPV